MNSGFPNNIGGKESKDKQSTRSKRKTRERIE
jgi:hypothetical protein